MQCFYLVVAAVCLVVAPGAMADASTVADPAMSGWINEVLANNPEIQAAQAAVEVAANRAHAANQPLFNPDLEFEYENSDIDRTTGGISQTIDWSDKRGSRTAVADYALEGADAELRAKRQEVATALLRALSDWHTADAIARVSGQQSELMARFVRLAERRRKAGDLGQVELDLAHLAAADATFQQAGAGEELIRARQAMTALTGAGDGDWPVITGQFPDIDPQRLDTERLLRELPSMRVALARVAGARASVQLRIREKRPDPTVGVRVGKEDSETLTGVTLSVPLFVRNTFRAEADIANAELIQAQHEAASHQRQAAADLVAAAEIYRNARHAWKSWESSGAHRLSQRTDLLDRLWQAGELDTTDYLVQLKQALDTEVSAIEQRGRMWQAWTNWLAASGQVEAWLNPSGEQQ
jgi:cobalt-zinc-cadmium efflux system outer membrane protein